MRLVWSPPEGGGEEEEEEEEDAGGLGNRARFSNGLSRTGFKHEHSPE